MAIITEVRSREIYRDRQAAQLDKSASAFSEYPEDDDDVPIRFLNYTHKHRPLEKRRETSKYTLKRFFLTDKIIYNNFNGTFK